MKHDYIPFKILICTFERNVVDGFAIFRIVESLASTDAENRPSFWAGWSVGDR